MWQTSAQRKGAAIVISGTTVTKTKQSWDDCTAVVSDGVTLTRGSSVKTRWSFTIKKGTQQTIGLVTAAYNAASHEYINKTTNGWGFYQGDGKTGHGGPANAVYGSKFAEGSVVDGARILISHDGLLPSFVPISPDQNAFVCLCGTVQVCSASRELRFFVNGVDQGVAYSNLPFDTPLYAAVSLYKEDSQTVYNVGITV